MEPEDIPPTKKFLLANAKTKTYEELTPEDVLVGERGAVRIADSPPMEVLTRVYSVDQGPCGDPYLLGENEILCLMLLIPPVVLRCDGKYIVKGCTKTKYIEASYSSKEAAFRTSRDFLQSGDKLDITVKEYDQASSEWKMCFGGYFSSMDFRMKSQSELPFSSKDIPYICPSKISSKYMKGPKEIRNSIMKAFTDRYGTITSDGNIIYVAPPDILFNVKTIAKSLGYLTIEESHKKLTVRVSKWWDFPSNCYPIKVTYIGEFQTHVSPNKERIILADGTNSYW